MEIGIIRMSSKGQIVIPASMRKGLSEGEKMLVIKEGERFILKPLSDLEESIREDIIFAEKTEKAFADYKKGNFIKKSDVDFINNLSSW